MRGVKVVLTVKMTLLSAVRKLFENGLRRVILTVPYHYDYRCLMDCAGCMHVYAVGGAKAILLLL